MADYVIRDLVKRSSLGNSCIYFGVTILPKFRYVCKYCYLACGGRREKRPTQYVNNIIILLSLFVAFSCEPTKVNWWPFVKCLSTDPAKKLSKLSFVS